MKIDLHNHTYLCNHAEGSVDEFTKAAIVNGIDIYGFSDHAPMDFDLKYRMSFEQMDLYRSMVLDAKKRYSSQIDILFGYEVDYLIGHMDRRVLDADVDYLIGSVHFLDQWGFDNPEFIGRYEGADIDEIWRAYFKQIELLATSKLFDIVAHLDLIKVFKFMPRDDLLDIAKDALDAIADTGMVLEINSAGYRKPVGEAYPSAQLLNAAYKRAIPICFGCDAHKVEQVGVGLDNIYRLAIETGYSKHVYFRNREKLFVEL